MRYQIVLLCLFVTLHTFTAMANVPYTKDVQLPKKELVSLEDMVCVKPHNLKAQSIQGIKDLQTKAAFDSGRIAPVR